MNIIALAVIVGSVVLSTAIYIIFKIAKRPVFFGPRYVVAWSPPKSSARKAMRKQRNREAYVEMKQGDLRRGRAFRTLRRCGLAVVNPKTGK